MLEKSRQQKTEKVFRKKIACSLVLKLFQQKLARQSRDRSANINRDYSHPLRVIREKNDDWLKRSYRLSRKLFYYVLKEISPHLLTKNPEMTQRSSGGPLSPEVLLAATLRFLAGGNYIDIVDLYQLPPTCLLPQKRMTNQSDFHFDSSFSSLFSLWFSFFSSNSLCQVLVYTQRREIPLHRHCSLQNLQQIRRFQPSPSIREKMMAYTTTALLLEILHVFGPRREKSGFLVKSPLV
jgi:hypothetical protein